MSRAIPPLPQYAFMEWYLVKHRDNFTFTFTFTLEICLEGLKDVTKIFTEDRLTPI
jgi:hypothetical protein